MLDSSAEVNRGLAQFLSDAELPGQPVIRFVTGLCELCPKISELRFRTYLPTANLSERLKAKKTVPPDLLAAALETAINARISFWDALASKVIREGKKLPRDVLTELLLHPHGEWERTFVLRRQEVLDGGINLIISDVHSNEGLALCSQ